MSLKLKSLALVSVLISGAALASEVRVGTLGRSAGIDDEAFVFAFPSAVNRYSLVLAEIGTSANNEGYAAVMTSASGHSFGVALSREKSLFNHRNTAGRTTDVPDDLTSFVSKYSMTTKYLSNTIGYGPKRPIDLFYGMNIAENTGFGVRLTMAGNINEAKYEDTVQRSASQTDVHFGFHMPLASGLFETALKLGVVGTVESTMQNATGGKTSVNFNRGIETRFLARYMAQGEAKTLPFVKVGFDLSSPTIKQVNNGQSQSKKAQELSFDLQGGVNAKPTELVLITGGLGYFYFKSEGPYSLKAASASVLEAALQDATEDVLLNLGGPVSTRTGQGFVTQLGTEAKLGDRWGLLMGLDYVLWGRLNTKDNYSPSKPSYVSNLTETPDANLWSFGTFYEIPKEFRLDASVSLKNFVHNGIFMVSGIPTANLIPQFAATYKF